MVIIHDVAHKLAEIQDRVRDSGIGLQLQGEHVVTTTGHQETVLRLIQLLRPSSRQVQGAAAPDALLVLVNPSAKAAEAARGTNHLVLPEGSFRLVVPGIALLCEVPPTAPTQERRTRLQGHTGLIAETLLSAGQRAWRVDELAGAASASPALIHRVLTRLEGEGWLEARGSGPGKTRTLINPLALAETWAQEEAAPRVALRGYLYGASPEAIMQRALEICPQGAIGGVMAANSYAPTLTRAPYPLRFWVPEGFSMQHFETGGLEETSEGSNLELVQSKGDHWQRHRKAGDLPTVSPWRAWKEVSAATGRTRDLANALLQHLEGDTP